MRLAARHSKTGERFRLMDDETLLRVMQRRHKHAADQPADCRAAQAEIRRRKAAGLWTLPPRARP